MTDNWVKTPLPCTPGYNYCGGAGPLFVVEYDAVTDILTITADQPVFGTVDTINYEGTNGTGQLLAPFESQTSTVITIAGAAINFSAPTDLTQLDFFNPGSVLVGIWTGVVNIPAGLDPANYPLLEAIYSPAPNQVAFVGQRFQTASAGGAVHGFVRLASYSTGCFEGPDMSFYLDGTPQPGDWTVIDFTDTLIVLENPSFSSCTPDDLATNFTANGVSLDAPNYGSPVGDGYYFWEPWGDTYSCEIDGLHPLPPAIDSVDVTGHNIQINGTGFDTGAWTVDLAQIRLIDTGDTPPPIYNAAAYDPSGPNSGSTSPGITINAWTDTLIDVTLDSTYDLKSYIGVFIWDAPHAKDVYAPQSPAIPLT